MRYQVTAYIPTLNSGKTLKRCIESLASQSYPIKEIFIVDGGSTDTTLKIARENSIRVVGQDMPGLASARNIALSHCRTKLLLSIDSDCRLEKDWLEKCVDILSKKGASGACGKLIEENKTSLADRWRYLHLRQDFGPEPSNSAPFLFGANSLFIAKHLKSIGGYNPIYTTNYEDVDICRRLSKTGKTLAYAPAARAYHMKKQDFRSVVMTARRFSFHSFPQPVTPWKLVKRVFIYNPYIFLREALKDIGAFSLRMAALTFLSLCFNQYYDIRYFLCSMLSPKQRKDNS